jgi:competence protein ComEA
MKIVHLMLIALFACTLSLSTFSADSFATSAVKEVTASADKVKKEIPHDVNINTADKALLTQLPGIGPVTADSIIQYRQTNGQFKAIDELTKVKGIGDKTLAKLKPYLSKI